MAEIEKSPVSRSSKTSGRNLQQENISLM